MVAPQPEHRRTNPNEPRPQSHLTVPNVSNMVSSCSSRLTRRVRDSSDRSRSSRAGGRLSSFRPLNGSGVSVSCARLAFEAFDDRYLCTVDFDRPSVRAISPTLRPLDRSARSSRTSSGNRLLPVLLVVIRSSAFQPLRRDRLHQSRSPVWHLFDVCLSPGVRHDLAPLPLMRRRRASLAGTMWEASGASSSHSAKHLLRVRRSRSGIVRRRI